MIFRVEQPESRKTNESKNTQIGTGYFETQAIVYNRK